MGTGVNGQIIGTSTYWRFELWTSLLLTALIIPLSYYLTVKYGLIGPAIANLVSFTIYNFTRYWFLLNRFALQPFSYKTIEVILLAVIIYSLVHFTMNEVEGLAGLFGRTIVFSGFFGAAIYYRNISPDIKPVVHSILKRTSLSK